MTQPVGRRYQHPLLWLGVVMALYLVVPLGLFAVRVLRSGLTGFGAPGLASALWVSIACSTVSCALIALFGIPLAYALARPHGRVLRVVGVLVQLPLAVPPVMAGILLIYVIGPYTPLGDTVGGRLTESMAAVVAAQTFVAAPFLIITARAAFGTVEPRLLDVAATLGLSPRARFRAVAVPLAAGGIRAGLVLAWLRAFGEYGATVVLAYHPTSLPVYTFTTFSAGGVPDTVAPTFLALLSACAAVAIGALRFPRRRSVPVRVGSTDERPRPLVTPTVARRLSFAIDYTAGDFHLTAAHRATTNRLAVLGASGAGKSMLLRCLAGLNPHAGPVWLDDRRLDPLPPEHRETAYVAQGFSLFPHRTVAGQLDLARDGRSPAAAEWVERLTLGELLPLFPAELSGGQCQRVALGQALARQPSVLLLDEPLSALDAPVRAELRRELRTLQRAHRLSTVVVTHDAEEAAVLADELIVLEHGEIVQAGPAPTVLERPATPGVARLLGVQNVAPGVLTPEGTLEIVHGHRVPAAAGTVPTPFSAAGTRRSVTWGIHAAHLHVLAPGAGGGRPTIPGRVVDRIVLPGRVDVIVTVSPDLCLEAHAEHACRLVPGDSCLVGIDPDCLLVWPSTSVGIEWNADDGHTPRRPAASTQRLSDATAL